MWRSQRVRPMKNKQTLTSKLVHYQNFATSRRQIKIEYFMDGTLWQTRALQAVQVQRKFRTFMSILTIGDDSWQCCCCRHVFTATNMKRNLHQDTFCSSFCYVINWNWFFPCFGRRHFLSLLFMATDKCGKQYERQLSHYDWFTLSEAFSICQGLEFTNYNSAPRIRSVLNRSIKPSS